MLSLDHKIPPPVIALVCAAGAWLLSRMMPALVFEVPARLAITWTLVGMGIALDIAGLLYFRMAKTTFNPLSPHKSSAIVQSGPFKFTRNPMYLGMVLELLGLCVYLANPLSGAAVVAFVAYITRFQIIPEERLLLSKFGEQYAQYTKSVRRWI